MRVVSVVSAVERVVWSATLSSCCGKCCHSIVSVLRSVPTCVVCGGSLQYVVLGATGGAQRRGGCVCCWVRDAPHREAYGGDAVLVLRCTGISLTAEYGVLWEDVLSISRALVRLVSPIDCAVLCPIVNLLIRYAETSIVDSKMVWIPLLGWCVCRAALCAVFGTAGS